MPLVLWSKYISLVMINADRKGNATFSSMAFLAHTERSALKQFIVCLKSMCLIFLMIECPVLIDWLSMNTVCQFDSSQIISLALVFTNVNKFLSCSVWLSAWLIVNLSDPILLVEALLPTGTDGQDGKSDALVNIKYYQYMYPIYLRNTYSMKSKLVRWDRSSEIWCS